MASFAGAHAADWPVAQLHRELFGGDRPFEIELARSGRIIQLAVGCTAAKALQDAGAPVLISCEQGVCGTCLTPVLRGEPEHRDQYLTPEEQAANDQFLPCCSRAHSERLVLEL